jgi:hypothetical protein
VIELKRREFIALLGGVLLAGGALLATAAFAQSIGRWTIGTPMPSARTEDTVRSALCPGFDGLSCW